MLIDAKCPACREKVPVTESAADQKIECHGCGKKFVVPASNPAPKAEATKPKERERDRDEPRGKSNSRRSRRDDDEDDDDRPRRRQDAESGSGMVGLLVIGGAGLTLLAIGFAITAWLIFSGDSKREKETADNSAKAAENRTETPARPTPPPSNNNVRPTPPPKSVPGPLDDDPPIKPKNNPKPMVDAPPPPRVEEPPPKPPRVEPPPKQLGPPPAEASPVVQLPGAATEQTVVGAGGKLLFLHLKTERQVAVFDPAQKKVVKYVPLNDEDAVLAAGLEHLIIGYPGLGKIDRVPLDTYQVDKSVDVPSKFPLRALGLGAFVKNPLLTACGNFPHGDEFFLIDVATMKRYENTVVKNPGQTAEPNTRIVVAQDGRTFGIDGGRFGGAQIYQMRTTGWSVSPVKFPYGGITADGEVVLGAGQLAGLDGRLIGEKKGNDRGRGVWYFASTQGPFFCSLNERSYGEWPKERKFAELQLHVGRSQEPLVAFPELPELAESVDFFFQKTKPLDRHVFFFPQNDLVAILPAARDRIHLRSVDVKAELEKSKINYLAVSSRPPSVKFGETFRYKPEILCKKGPPTLRLDASPAGMKLEGDTLVWTVPTRANQPPANVILTVTDAAGQEMFHSFEVTVFAK